MQFIVGYSGFVGSNICKETTFDGYFRSTNVNEAYGQEPDLLVYAGLRAEKFLANSDPARDMASVQQALENIRSISPDKLVLISTVDVYKEPNKVDETTHVDAVGLAAYGLNRYWLEQRVREEFPDSLIVRLPGLYGINLKKNFLYDLIHRIPSMLKPTVFETLVSENPRLADCYSLVDSGFYKLQSMADDKRRKLRAFFIHNRFSAVNFTDSRSTFQLYPLRFLWEHIQIAMAQNLTYLNIAVEPVSAQEIFQATEGKEFCNEIAAIPAHYDMRSCHAQIFGGQNGYLMDRGFLLDDIVHFVLEQKRIIYGEGNI